MSFFFVLIFANHASNLAKHNKKKKKQKIKLTKKKDKSLIAGFTLDFDNQRLDASVKKRLEKMQKQLKTT